MNKKDKYGINFVKCDTHLQSCQRFLEFLISIPKRIRRGGVTPETEMTLTKQADLQDAIKHYKGNGIE